jgi:hypothetical protein
MVLDTSAMNPRFVFKVLLGLALVLAPARAEELLIDGIRAEGTNLVVTVQVPAGVRRATLETRPRMARGTWTPREVKWPDGAAGEVVFRVAMSSAMELIRVRTDDTRSLPLPASFYNHQRTYDPVTTTTNPAQGRGTAGIPLSGDAATEFNGGSGSVPRQVVESDIWKRVGNEVFFFNQSRGLQVIDVSDPDAPQLRGAMPITSWGEDLYVLPASTHGVTWLALLARRECQWDASEVLLVRVAGGVPTLTDRLPLHGAVAESRLIGDVLVVASRGWTNFTTTNIVSGRTNISYTSESLCWVSSFDLANPAQPRAPSVLMRRTNPTAISATDQFVFLAASTEGRWEYDSQGRFTGYAPPTNTVTVIDVSDPTGVVTEAGAFRVAGRVADKFKMHLRGDSLAVVSQTDGRWEPGPVISNPWADNRWRPPVVTLETFSLTDPAQPTRQGLLSLITNESVFATRYDGDRVYVVTFRQVDPLWIIDLANPAAPAIRGHLEVPGFSTYIQPLGDRLLAMGVEGGRAAVSLFDVSNVAAPALVSKVFMGDGWSWSEANADEKAFRVFPESGLVLLPWHGRQGDGWFQGIQLLDFSPTNLTLRGTVDHQMPARRATVAGNRVFSVSSAEFLSVDIADRDRPTVKAELSLSRSVERVLAHGSRLLQVTTDSSRRELILTEPGEYTPALARLALTNIAISGATVRGDELFLLQIAPDSWVPRDVVSTQAQIRLVPQPPVQRFETNRVVAIQYPPARLQTVTNIEIFERPQPSLLVCTSVWRLTEFPATPVSPGFTTNILRTFCREVPQPPIRETNVIVSTVLEFREPVVETRVTPQEFVMAAQTVCTSLWQSIEVPADPPYITNWFGTYCRDIPSRLVSWTNVLVTTRWVTPPGTRVTNIVVATVFDPVPPLSETNWVTVTNRVHVQVPGESVFSVISVSGDSLALTGQVRFASSNAVPWSTYQPLWPDADTLVWSSGGSSGFGWYLFDGPYIGRPGLGLIADDGIGFGGWYWGGSQPNLLALDVRDASAPVLAASLRLAPPAATDLFNEWVNGTGSFAADGKVFVGLTQSGWRPGTSATVWGGDGRWTSMNWLAVVDFADPAEPAVRAPLVLPGSLSGVSHRGNLVYSQRSSWESGTGVSPISSLTALAYDGVALSEVASLTNAPGTPVLVREDGKVLIGRPGSSNSSPALEVWAISTEGRLERFGSTALPSAVWQIERIEDLALVRMDGVMSLVNVAVSFSPEVVGTGGSPCNVWWDTDRSALTRGPFTLWMPGVGLGIGRVSFHSP